MDFFEIALLVIVLGSFFLKTKKTFSGATEDAMPDVSDSPYESAPNVGRSEGSPFSFQDGNDFFSYDNEVSQYSSSEAAYEAGSNNFSQRPQPASSGLSAQPAKATVLADEADEACSSLTNDFNLRQAVVYQTILTNKYLSEVPSYEN